ncbi:PTS sugar transporter subunit IIA [Klebsiella sp. 20_N_Kleb]|uniref:PTS sugar transporter subunit IIA n=1 Tax=Klebsiella sp. 20_N_Kleb TaxID=3391445 RepID=UPI003D16D304
MIDNITLDNLHIGCKASNKAEVIAMIGAECKAKGYVNQECVHFLLEREHQVSTFLGNGITLPHLPKSATDIILKTGIEIYQFPDGVIWDRRNVMFIAIGVIAKEKEHIDVLKEIASIFSDELIANALSLISDKNDFLKILQHNALPR